MSRLPRILGILTLAAAVRACVSTETMTSADIKSNVIAQTYSTVCRIKAGMCASLAQFRIGDHAGPTLEIAKPGEVLINARATTFYDARTANRVLDTLSYLSFAPLFQLYKTGSWYYATYGITDKHVFDFADDAGHRHRSEIWTRGLAQAGVTPRAAKALGEFTFRLVESLVPGESVACALTLSPGPNERIRYGSAEPTGDAHRCVFATSPIEKPRQREAYRLVVTRSLDGDAKDDLGRLVRTVATTELEVDGVLKE